MLQCQAPLRYSLLCTSIVKQAALVLTQCHLLSHALFCTVLAKIQ